MDGKTYQAIELVDSAGSTLTRIGLGKKHPKLEKLTECLRCNGIELQAPTGDDK